MHKRLIGLGLFTIAVANAWAMPPIIERISVSSESLQADAASFVSAISADGNIVAFSSAATNLVAGDANGAVDIFVRDRKQGTTERVSIGINNTEANAASGIDVYTRYRAYDPYPYTYGRLDTLDISANGRYIAFSSRANNLIVGDTNQTQDIFVYDRQSSTTERVSIGTDGVEGNARSFKPSLSKDGRYVAFLSEASSLVANDKNNKVDVFVRDRQTGVTTRVNVGSQGLAGNGDAESAHISADGRFVVFSSAADNLIPPQKTGYLDRTNLFVRDRINGVTNLVSNQRVGSVEDMDMPDISSDGRYVAFLGYAVRSYNLSCYGPSFSPYFQDRTAAIAIALDWDGYLGIGEPSPNISGGCLTTTFSNYLSIEPQMAVNLNIPYKSTVISGNQRYIVFNSALSVERYDRLTGMTEGASYNANNPPDEWPTPIDTLGDVSANGRIVSFTTTSEQRVDDDSNGVADILVSDSGPAPAFVPKAGTNLSIEFYRGTSLSVPVNQVFVYTLYIVNQGPNAVAGLSLTANVPADFKVLSAASDIGSCKPGNRFDCNIGNLPIGAEARITVQMRARKTIGKAGIQASSSFYVRDSKGKIPVLANGKPNPKFLKRIKSKAPLTVNVTR